MIGVETLIATMVASVAPIFAKPGIDHLTEMLTRTIESFQQKGVMKDDEINQLTEAARKAPPPPIHMAMRSETLSRWFEIPHDDFERLPKEKLDPGVLIRHLYVEYLVTTWLEEFGYKVEVGSKMLGVEGWEFMPDIYGQVSTLHGHFQVAVNLICDDPPSTSRVSFLCESIEAFAAKKEPAFGDKDIFILVTPFKFSSTAHSVILKEDKDHEYYVIRLEGSDLYKLAKAQNSSYRLAILQNVVSEAYGTAGRKTWA